MLFHQPTTRPPQVQRITPITDPQYKGTATLFVKLKKTIPLTKEILEGTDQIQSKEMTAIVISVHGDSGYIMKDIITSLQFIKSS